MTLLLGFWASCSLLVLWGFFVAGRLRSAWWPRVALLLGVLPLVGLAFGEVSMPSLGNAELLGMGGASLGLLMVWGGAVRWARRRPLAPRVDASRMRWEPRPSHRPTWVLAAGLSTLLSIALVLLGKPVVAVLPWLALFVAHRWAHHGGRGTLHVGSRDVVFAGERFAIDELSQVLREVRFLGPVRRERLVVKHKDRLLRWLVTGSPSEDVVAVQHLLHRQQDFANRHLVEREPPQRPPDWLLHLQQAGGRPVALGPNGKPT